MASWRKAINEKCRQCIYEHCGGKDNGRQQVSACTCKDCPLYPLRQLSNL